MADPSINAGDERERVHGSVEILMIECQRFLKNSVSNGAYGRPFGLRELLILDSPAERRCLLWILHYSTGVINRCRGAAAFEAA